MKTQPLFSVLIANYNNGKYLMEAIDSVRQQTYANWEIVLVDDASTDNSRELYVELKKDERIHIYRNEQNMGCGFTKNRCVELANGEICGFLDPDDALSLNALNVMVETHAKYSKASLIHSDHYDCDKELNIKRIYHGEQIPNNESFLRFQRGVSHFATFKKKLYAKTMGINPLMTCAVDMDLYYLLDEVGKFIYIPEVLYYYRTGTGSNISLGENMYKAFVWDTIAQYNAVLRRKWNIDEEFCSIVINNIKHLTNIVSDERVLQKENFIRQTKTYRIGRLFTYPFKWLTKQ